MRLNNAHHNIKTRLLNWTKAILTAVLLTTFLPLTYGQSIRERHLTIDSGWFERTVMCALCPVRQYEPSLFYIRDTVEELRIALADAQLRLEQITRTRDSLSISNANYQQALQEQNKLLEDKIRALQEKERLIAEKEQLYLRALNSSSLDSAKFSYELRAKEASIELKSQEIAMLQRNIDARDSSLRNEKSSYDRLIQERNQYMRIVDSLRSKVVAAEIEAVRKQEENKYLAERAKAAEEKVAAATNRKKKVRPVQGIAMRFFRTPDWNIRLTPQNLSDGTITFHKQIWNRNAGSIEFDFITGASVMLWDLTKYFNTSESQKTSSGIELRRFDQQFAYDLGIYVGFGGTNLFKNFYVGPSFRFVDFFYLTIGINICEYEMLSNGYSNGQVLTAAETLENIIAKSWLIKPFISLSIDLDFLSYIKK